ncbi:hypothetical protein D8Y22_03690 [Salinadaptatus halalkaliphilus]|uniref:Uncharacterized protein n=1 Tax=Salinadaptatus halalkaliphilus TaxID=2419781 RepID=A0A4V3VLL7_9EURY|nr:hypothetical protein [Salinadaptatus halalkaliphilus]THE66037.1 hypothetical protein D8Y22_03690 [Salinadaptatus halalkaliphilus]
MVTLETSVVRTNGVTTVRVVIDNQHSTHQAVRLQSTLEGPVWPPRRDGVVDPQWDGDIWDGTIRSGRTRGIGFASPAPPTDPPVDIVSSDRLEADDLKRSPGEILAALDGWRPSNEVLESER